MGSVPSSGIDRDADAGRRGQFTFIDGKWFCEGRDHLFGDGGGFVAVRQACGHDQEFVAAQARHHVLAAHRSGQALCDLAQQGIAGGMPEGVIDLLEIVEVEVHRPYLAAVPAGATHRLDQAVIRQDPVRQAGEQVVVGLIGDLFHLRALLGDVFAGKQQMGRAPFFVVHRAEAEPLPIGAVAAPARLLDLPDAAGGGNPQGVVGIERIGGAHHFDQRLLDQVVGIAAGDATVGRIDELDHAAYPGNQDADRILFHHLGKTDQAAIGALQVGSTFGNALFQFDLGRAQCRLARQDLLPHAAEGLGQVADLVVARDRDGAAFLAGRQPACMLMQDADAPYHGLPRIGQAGKYHHAAEQYQPEEFPALRLLFLGGLLVGLVGCGLGLLRDFGKQRLNRQVGNVGTAGGDATHAGQVHVRCEPCLLIEARSIFAPMAGEALRRVRRLLAQHHRKGADFAIQDGDFAAQAGDLRLQGKHVLQMPQLQFHVAQVADPGLQAMQPGQGPYMSLQGIHQALGRLLQHPVSGKQQRQDQQPCPGEAEQQLLQEAEAGREFHYLFALDPASEAARAAVEGLQPCRQLFATMALGDPVPFLCRPAHGFGSGLFPPGRQPEILVKDIEIVTVARQAGTRRNGDVPLPGKYGQRLGGIELAYPCVVQVIPAEGIGKPALDPHGTHRNIRIREPHGEQERQFALRTAGRHHKIVAVDRNVATYQGLALLDSGDRNGHELAAYRGTGGIQQLRSGHGEDGGKCLALHEQRHGVAVVLALGKDVGRGMAHHPDITLGGGDASRRIDQSLELVVEQARHLLGLAVIARHPEHPAAGTFALFGNPMQALLRAMEKAHQLIVFLPGFGYREFAPESFAKGGLLHRTFEQVAPQVHQHHVAVGGYRHQPFAEIALQARPDIAGRRFAIDAEAELLGHRQKVFDQALIQQVGEFVGTRNRQVDVRICLQVEQCGLLRNHACSDHHAGALLPLLLQFQCRPQQRRDVARLEGHLDHRITPHFARGNHGVCRRDGALGLFAGDCRRCPQHRCQAQHAGELSSPLVLHHSCSPCRAGVTARRVVLWDGAGRKQGRIPAWNSQF
jgi:hypothetical protein